MPALWKVNHFVFASPRSVVVGGGVGVFMLSRGGNSFPYSPHFLDRTLDSKNTSHF